MTEDQINRRWVEILLDTLSAEKSVTIGPRDASCFINGLRALLAAHPGHPEPTKCDDGGNCGAEGYCNACPHRQPEPRAEVADDDKVCAERYRYLRSRPESVEPGRIDVVYWSALDESANEGDALRGDALDAAIDAARTGASS
ncbi:hypothetical protein [Burkholderia thailandensis]|uniref:hypothetical protein n=1 Tax=Burkholderia thailandensis TaxID=57975 RepID=UPI0005B6DC87|nr:hypothetical protein [Burkholderia thailandensis]KIS56802.1 hypothetical protein BTP_2355 [Burkholderia thailandensis Phuket 4W-1]